MAKLPRRLIIMLYDALLLMAVLMLASALIVAIRMGEPVPSGALWFEGYLLLVSFLYFGYCWTKSGQTLGLKSWRTRIQQIDGSAITWQQALIRFVTALLSWLALGLGHLWVLFDKEGLSWHDRLSGTRMVRVEK